MANPWKKYQGMEANTNPNMVSETKPWERYAGVAASDPMAGKSDAKIENYIMERINKSRETNKAKETMATLPGALRTSAERILNSATFGGYGALNNALGGNFDERNRVGQENLENAGLGFVNTASNLVNDIAAGAPLGAGIYNAVGRITTRTLPRVALSGAAAGGLYSGLNSRGSIGERAEDALMGAGIGGVAGGIIPIAAKGVNYARKGIKNATHLARNGINRATGRIFERAPEDIAAGAQEISGLLPDNGETAGQAVRNLSDDVLKGIKAETKMRYDKVDEAAAAAKVVLGKNSNFARKIQELSQNTTKSGRAELNRIYNELGHTAKDAPSYRAVKSMASNLSEKSASGGTALGKYEYGSLKEALEQDMQAALGKETLQLKKEADAFFRKEMSDPNSLTQSSRALIGAKPASDSVIGNRAISSAQGKAWKASPLDKLLKAGDEISSPYANELRNTIQANTTTRAQFNRMSPEQKQMIFGDKLRAAEKNFNGGLLNFLENMTNKSVDLALNPVERALKSITPVGGLGASSVYNNILSQILSEQ